MDEMERYQQRLQAIAEKRRLQEEEERRRREMEEERLKLEQLKRKSLREQWLMDSPPSAPDGPETDSPLQEAQTQRPEEELGDTPQTERPRLAEEQLKDLVDGRRQTHPGGVMQGCSKLRGETPGGDREQLEGWTQGGVADLRIDPCSQAASLKNGHEARSVLGMVELQVEKDLRTGATVVLSVAPVARGQLGGAGETVFDDGRRSVRALGATGPPPGPEELGQILDVLTGAGLQAVLGDAKSAVANGRVEGEELGEEPEERRNKQEVRREEEEEEEEEEQMEEAEQEAQDAPAKDDRFEADTDADGDFTHNALRQEVTASDRPERRGSPQLGGGGEGWGGPVTMTFLGFAEAEEEEESAEVIRAERVILTEEGDEVLQGEATENPSVPPPATPSPQESETNPAEQTPAASALLQSEPPAKGGAEPEEGGALKQEQGGEGQPLEDSTLLITPNCSQLRPLETMATAPPTANAQEEEEGGAEAEARDIPLAGKGVGGGTSPQDNRRGVSSIPATPTELQPLVSVRKESLLPSRAGAATPPKHKTCQCCSVM